MSTAVFPQRFSFFTACLVLSLYLGFQLAEKCTSDTISDYRSIALHRLSGVVAISLGTKSFFRSFEEKLTRRVKLKRLSFIAQFKINVLLPFTGCRKVLRKMFDLGVSTQISFPMLLT